MGAVVPCRCWDNRFGRDQQSQPGKHPRDRRRARRMAWVVSLRPSNPPSHIPPLSPHPSLRTSATPGFGRPRALIFTEVSCILRWKGCPRQSYCACFPGPELAGVPVSMLLCQQRSSGKHRHPPVFDAGSLPALRLLSAYCSRHTRAPSVFNAGDTPASKRTLWYTSSTHMVT